MKTLLMHRDRDFDLQQELARNEQALTQDLELNTLFRAMANDDEFLFDVVRKAILSGLRNDVDTIVYRQAILNDCLANPAVIRGLYDLAVEAIENKKKHYWSFLSNYPSSILHGSTQILQMFMDMLRKLRAIADEQAGRFASEGFATLFATLQRELSDEYLAGVHGHLTELELRDGVLLSGELGMGNAGIDYILRQTHETRQSWLVRLLGKGPPGYTFRIADRDEAGAKALANLRDRGINLVANALAQSADHILGFFQTLRVELAFYVGCLNLRARLEAKGEPVCFPQPAHAGQRKHRCDGLYDVCLALTMQPRVVGNTLEADGKRLVVITGANQGGKSSFLRAIGLAQLMMRSGMFVAAEYFAAELCTGLFTHYKREEDATMTSGKFDEELSRLSEIVDRLTPDSMLLFNESFAATNDREGSEIAGQVVRALLDKRLQVFFVTHLHEFAHRMFETLKQDAVFLRAERNDDGTRTFKLVEGEPLDTSYGEDLYRQVFEAGTQEGSTA